jgi:hypothetical protein
VGVLAAYPDVTELALQALTDLNNGTYGILKGVTLFPQLVVSETPDWFTVMISRSDPLVSSSCRAIQCWDLELFEMSSTLLTSVMKPAQMLWLQSVAALHWCQSRSNHCYLHTLYVFIDSFPQRFLTGS